MVTTDTLEWAISKGVVGVLSLGILAMVYVIRSLWEQVNKLQAEKDQIQKDRLADAAKNTDALLNVQEKTHEAIDALDKVSDEYEKAVAVAERAVEANNARRSRP